MQKSTTVYPDPIAKNRFHAFIVFTLNTFRLYVMRYPPVAAFFIVLTALSAFPIILFLTFAGVTLSGLSGLATAIVGTIEGVLLAASGSLLAIVLIAATLISLVTVFSMSVVWCGLSASRWALNSFECLLSNITSQTAYATTGGLGGRWSPTQTASAVPVAPVPVQPAVRVPVYSGPTTTKGEWFAVGSTPSPAAGVSTVKTTQITQEPIAQPTGMSRRSQEEERMRQVGQELRQSMSASVPQ